MWQDEWPQTEGYWWFYGCLYGTRNDAKPELTSVKVKWAGPDDRRFLIFVANGAFVSQKDPDVRVRAVGKWQKAIEPELPDTL